MYKFVFFILYFKNYTYRLFYIIGKRKRAKAWLGKMCLGVKWGKIIEKRGKDNARIRVLKYTKRLCIRLGHNHDHIACVSLLNKLFYKFNLTKKKRLKVKNKIK